MIVDLLKRRFSVRNYQKRPIPVDVLEVILEAGRLTPSGGNEQPWLFGVITDEEIIAAIADLAYKQVWIARSPCVIVLCTVGVSDARGGRDIQGLRYPQYRTAIAEMERGLYLALNQEEHQTKIAGTHMVLEAWEQGVGACWVSKFNVPGVAQLLNLPAESAPSELLVLGYPAGRQVPQAKKELKEIVFYNRYSCETG